MDNGFGDDDGLRQARSRRRFQTGLLIFLLLFFMDARGPQETQTRQRAAQAKRIEENRKITGRTVDRLVTRLAEDLEHAPQGPFYHLRDQSSIKGEWHRAEGEEFQTVVPVMKEKPGFKPRPDLRNETIAPSKAGKVPFKSPQMTAALVPSKGKDVSTVHGRLNLGSSVTQSGSEAVFEGLFFHKYGHLSAVVGALGEDLKLVWNLADEAKAEASALAGAPVVPDDPGGRLAMGNNGVDGNGTATAAPGGDNAETVGMNSTEGGVTEEAKAGKEEEEEQEGEEEGVAVGDAGGDGGGEAGEGAGGGSDRRERALRSLAARRGEAGDGIGVRSGLGWLERASPGSIEQVAKPAEAAGGRTGALGGWVWSEEEDDEEEEVGGEGAGAGGGRRGAADQSGRTGGLRSKPSHEASLQRHGRDTPAVAVAGSRDEQPPAGGDGSSPLLRRRLDTGGEGAVPRDVEAAAAAAAGDTGVVELEASMMAETKVANNPVDAAASPEAGGDGGEAEAAEAKAGTGVLTREFPAWVLPKAALLEVGQDSGPMPSYYNGLNLRKENTEGCQYMLTLQTVEDDDVDAHAEDEPKADLMRGEMVGINCDFSVVVEFQMSDSLLRSAQSQSMSYSVALTMVCLLQMCLLCCRVGLMMAQRRYGRNFMVPRRFQPPKFDYHRPIPPELAEQAQTQTAGGQHSEETRDIEAGNLLECAICYAAVDSALEDYMLTPCDHVFHQGCLTRWMDIKMECPTCRRELPPQLERPAS